MSGKNGSGKFTIVDDEDVEKVAGRRWHLSSTGYAVNRSKHKTIRMHRLINKTPDGYVTDHKNNNPLDNRKSNLRTVSQEDNLLNMSGTKGYTWDKSKSMWMVRYRGKFYGRYQTEEEARRAYRLAKSGVPRPDRVHPRRKYLPKGVYFMKPMAQQNRSPYYIRPTVNGKKNFMGYFRTIAEAEAAYIKLSSAQGG